MMKSRIVNHLQAKEGPWVKKEEAGREVRGKDAGPTRRNTSGEGI